MIRKSALVCLVVWLFFALVAPCYADVFLHEMPLAAIAPKLPKLGNVTCKFRQEKFISSSNATLKSGGDFTFDKTTGVTFYTTYPIKATTTYNSTEYKQINGIIKAIANKSYSVIEKDFRFYYEETPVGWRLGLKPKNTSNVQKYLNFIVIEGRVDISKIVISATNGVKTTIYFENKT